MKRFYLFPALFIGALCVHAEERTSLTGDALKQRLQGNYSESISAADRLKASRGDPDALHVLRREDIQYRLPDGTYVLGMLLPNGKMSPAMRDNDKLVPACVTTTYERIPGEWDGQAVRCDLRQDALIVLTDKNSVQQISRVKDDAVPGSGNSTVSQSHKYASAGPASPDSSDAVFHDVAPPIHQNVPATGEATAYPVAENGAAEPRPVSHGSIYVPPARNSSHANTVAGVLRHDPNQFGVTIGTWVKAELTRPVSSAESGLIEFTLTEDLVGRYRTMPAGTVIFSDKSINEIEKRLESLSQLATLPDGTEISGVMMQAFSLDKTAGISGTLVRDREGEMTAVGSDAALSTLSALTPAVAGAAGTAVNAVSSGVIGNEKRYAPQTPRAVIRVTAQPVYLKVAKTF